MNKDTVTGSAERGREIERVCVCMCLYVCFFYLAAALAEKILDPDAVSRTGSPARWKLGTTLSEIKKTVHYTM